MDYIVAVDASNITFGDAGAAQACIAMNGATMGERWLKIENYTEKPKRTYDNTHLIKDVGIPMVDMVVPMLRGCEIFHLNKL